MREHIGLRFKQVRQVLRLTMVALAERIGTTNGYISQIESGKTLVSIPLLISLKQVFGVNVDWLLTGQGEMFEQRGELEELRARPDPETRIEDTLREFEERLRKLEQQQTPPPRVRKGFQ
ncbi:MAG: helix-turn-helix transcriptional regulator [Armatimonadetes bacterium]|nr:helix-turn-helix transcriptional regulator [Armatimonadota bacterium]